MATLGARLCREASDEVLQCNARQQTAAIRHKQNSRTWSAGGAAPTVSPTLAPLLKAMNVGIYPQASATLTRDCAHGDALTARTPTSWAMSCASSTSTL